MDEQPQKKFSTSDSCLLHLLALKFAMAGDMESAEPLDTLIERARVIKWDDPAFVQFSQEMRAGVPDLTPEQEAALLPSILPLIHALTEEGAKESESRAVLTALIKKAIKQKEEMNATIKRLTVFSSKMIDLNRQMKDRLEVLGDDGSGFEIPKV